MESNLFFYPINYQNIKTELKKVFLFRRGSSLYLLRFFTVYKQYFYNFLFTKEHNNLTLQSLSIKASDTTSASIIKISYLCYYLTEFLTKFLKLNFVRN